MEIPMREPGTSLRGYGGAANRLRTEFRQRMQRLRLASRVILVGLLISFAGILWLSQTSSIVALGYDMQKIDKRVIELNREAEVLQSQVAAFENPKRVEDEAKGKLGMVPATKYIYVKVPPSEVQTDENGRDNPKLYPVNNWWRELTEMLPRPWQNSAPSQKPVSNQGSGSNGQ